MTDVLEIKKPADCRYLSVAETIEANGHRHMRNAVKHFTEGRPEWAVGSMRKAGRNFERARRVALSFDSLSDRILAPMTNALAELMAEAIL